MCATGRFIGSRRERGRICRFSDPARVTKAGVQGLMDAWARSKVFVSFGGLLLYIEGPYKKLTPLRIEYIYLLMKK